MNFASVYHRASEQFAYAKNEKDLVINIKTGYDVEHIYLHYGDPFDTGILGGNQIWSGRREEIVLRKKLRYHYWWSASIRPPYKRCRYFFELVSKEERFYYFEDGFYTSEQKEKPGKRLQCFTFPWMNTIDINTVPEWVNETVWYQIFPERFRNGNLSCNPPEVKAWDSRETIDYKDYYGGDLQGIIDRLDYLKGLGINGLYLTPIFEADSNHKYNTKDYQKIDPAFGNSDIVKQLINEAHKRSIKVMFDGVFNHCGENFAPWQDVRKKGRNSNYFDWFFINCWPFEQNAKHTKDGSYYSFAFASGMPKLNTNNPPVREYFLNIVRSWIEDYDIDGLRLDVANEVSHQFLKELRTVTKSIKEDFYLLGEIWHDSVPWLLGDELDAVMNYPLASVIEDFWLYKEKTKDDFEYEINQIYTRYMEQTNNILFQLLDSHDTERLFYRTKDLNIFFQQLAILFTMPGSPCIFYGTEIAMYGGPDPCCRRCMPWDEIENGNFNPIIEQVTKLILLRRANLAMRSSVIRFTDRISEKRFIEYEKTDTQGNKLQVLLNCSKKSVFLKEEGEVLFDCDYKDEYLQPNGTVIRKLPK